PHRPLHDALPLSPSPTQTQRPPESPPAPSHCAGATVSVSTCLARRRTPRCGRSGLSRLGVTQPQITDEELHHGCEESCEEKTRRQEGGKEVRRQEVRGQEAGGEEGRQEGRHQEGREEGDRQEVDREEVHREATR